MDRRPVSSYWELRPPPSLAAHVQCGWVHRLAAAEPYVQPVIPDGCIDLVAVDGDVVVAGPATRTKTVRLLPGTLTVGVRFRTGAAPAVLGVAAAELVDRDVGVDEVLGHAGAGLAERVAAAVGWQARAEELAAGVFDRLRTARPVDPVGAGIATALVERPGRTIRTLAADVGLSERQLRRRVEDAVGYPPRLLARILRFQRFLRAARAAGPARNLARLAADAGYADQAHLTRDSRALSGLPPAALLEWEAARLAG